MTNKFAPFADEREFAAYLKRVDYGDTIDGYNDRIVVPEDYRDALLLTAAKWHPENPRRGKPRLVDSGIDSCGVCSWDSTFGDSACHNCPLEYMKSCTGDPDEVIRIVTRELEALND